MNTYKKLKNLVCLSWEQVRFRLYASKQEKDLLTRSYLGELQFYKLFSKLETLHCYRMQMDLIEKHIYLAEKLEQEAEDTEPPISAEMLERFHNRMVKEFPFLKKSR